MTLPNALRYAGERRSASADARGTRRAQDGRPPPEPNGRAHPEARDALPGYTSYLLDVSAAVVSSVPVCDAPAPHSGVHASRAGLRTRIRAMTHAMQHDVSYTVLIVALLYVLRYRQGIARAGAHAGCAPFSRDLVLLGALVLASKYVNDHPQTNGHWAAVLGVPVDVVNVVERAVLAGMRYRMHVAPAGFSAWVSFLFDAPRLHAYLRSL